MKFSFHTSVSVAKNGNSRVAHVRLGQVTILLMDNMVMAVSDSKRSYAKDRDYTYEQWSFIKDGNYALVGYQELLFQMNRMLFEQAESVLTAAIDKEIGE